LRLTKSCTTVKWSPNEDKFAVGSGAKAISVCYYDEEGKWWVSRLIKNLTSTVLCLSWHPNNFLLAVGGTDSAVTIYSAFIKEIDISNKKLAAAGTVFGKFSPKEAVGCNMASFNSDAWVHSVAFSPSGGQLAWTTRRSDINFLNCQTSELRHQNLKLRTLPLTTIYWAGENSLIAAGHDCTPYLFQQNGGAYSLVKDLDQGDPNAKLTSTVSAKSVFEKKTNLGLESTEENDTVLTTKHQNRIIEVRHHTNSSFATCGCDGNIIIWPYNALGIKIQ